MGLRRKCKLKRSLEDHGGSSDEDEGASTRVELSPEKSSAIQVIDEGTIRKGIIGMEVFMSY